MEEKSEDDKKYIIFNTDSIKSFCEANGNVNIDEKVFLLLSEDISYRLREVVNNAAQIMKHSKRKKLTTNDINKSLKGSNCKTVHGFGDDLKPVNTVHIPEANVFCIDDKELDVLSMAARIIDGEQDVQLQTNVPKLSLDWLAVEGKSSSACLESSVQHAHQVDHRTVSNYYETVAAIVLDTDKVAFNLILNDLVSNSRVQFILPNLVNFVSLCVKRLNTDLKFLRRCLQLIAALFRNRYLYLYTEPYLNLLTHSILFCIIEPLTAVLNPSCDHWSLRESAAYLLSNVLTEWNSPFIVTGAVNMIVNTLVECIKDVSKPFASHFGVIVAFKALGYEYIEEYLFPNLTNFWPHLTTALSSDSVCAQSKVDAQKVFGALRDVSVLFLQLSAVNSLNESSDENNSSKQSTAVDDYNTIYGQLEEHFGDSLSSCVAVDCEKLSKLFKKKQTQQQRQRQRGPEIVTPLFATQASEQTGEQLLDAFYEFAFEETKSSNSVGSNYNSEDEHSNESELAAKLDGDLLIKSTISDPTLGIKLTIKKVRRAHESSDSDSNTKKSSKRKKCVKMYKDSNEPVFEECRLKSKFIRISIPGCTQKAIKERNGTDRTTVTSVDQRSSRNSSGQQASLASRFKCKGRTRMRITNKAKHVTFNLSNLLF